MKIGLKSVVNGNVFYNQLTNLGTIKGTQNSPLALPLGGFPPFIMVDSTVMKAPNYTLDDYEKDTLRLGTYGNVVVEHNARLYLRPGVYNFRSFKAQTGAKLLFTGNSQCQIRVKYGFSGDNSAYVGPAPGSTLSGASTIIYVNSTDAQSGCTYAINMGVKSTLIANVVAPNGTILLNQAMTANGAFFGKFINVGQGAKLSLSTAFGTGSNKIVPNAERQDESPKPAAGVVKSYALSQNYPNPFNPATHIEYALPVQSKVTIRIYNVLGQVVQTLVDGVQNEGYRSVVFNANQFASGLYFYRMDATNVNDPKQTYNQVRKMLLVK
jgi:hypothetical protein